MKLLAADTALGACSAALVEDGRVLAHRFVPMERGHAEALAPMVEEIMTGHDFASLDRLAVTTGPGTFTGQRVGLAFMRALKVALHVPLNGVTTLAAMEAQACAETGAARAIALHDARRDEVYVAIDGVPQVMLFADAIAMLRGRGSGERIALAGTGANRACEALADSFFVSDVFQPDALWVARLAADAGATDTVPRPLYLRAPDAKLPAASAPRAVATEDLAELARLHGACFAKAWDERALAELLKTPGIVALIVPHGFVMARAASNEAEVLTLAVEPAARRRGLGAALLSAAAERVHTLGANALLLEVGQGNDAARTLYERAGFAVVGRRKSYYDAEEDALILKRDLPLAPLGNVLVSAKVTKQPPGNDRDAD